MGHPPPTPQLSKMVNDRWKNVAGAAQLEDGPQEKSQVGIAVGRVCVLGVRLARMSRDRLARTEREI